MEEVKSPILSQYQAQGVTVTLRILERILFSVEELYSRQEEIRNGVMVSLANPLSQQERARLADLVRLARASINAIATRFGLKHETADLTRDVHGRLVEMWSALEDTRAHKLRRYGHVDPALSAALDPGIEELINLVLAMDEVLFQSGSASPDSQSAQTNGKEHIHGGY